MRKVLICNVKMNKPPEKLVYRNDDPQMPASENPVMYPVTAFLEDTLEPGDELDVIMLAKMDITDQYEENISLCIQELKDAAEKNHTAFRSEIVYSPFEENQETHGNLLLNIVEKIPEKSSLIVDMTYGPKDLAIVEFEALHFLEDFLECEVEHIIYGQAAFVNGCPTDGKLCDMSSLYYISSLMNKVRYGESGCAINMLKVLLDRA